MSMYAHMDCQVPLPTECPRGRIVHGQSYFRAEQVWNITITAQGQLLLDEEFEDYTGEIEFFVMIEPDHSFEIVATFRQGRLAPDPPAGPLTSALRVSARY